MHRFRELKVYQRSLQFTTVVRTLTAGFPKEELYVLTSQFRRAADSIVLNISEGAGNESDNEFSRFLIYSIRSGYECLGCLDVALNNKLIVLEKYHEMEKEVQEIIAMLVGLQQSLLRTR